MLRHISWTLSNLFIDELTFVGRMPAFRCAPCGPRAPRQDMMRKIISALILFIAAVFPHGAHAFPERPVRLVVSSPPGGPPDIMARLVSEKLAAMLGQPVVVENRPGGAGGTIAAKSGIAGGPDGYT